MEEASRCGGEQAIHVDITATSILAGVGLDAEHDRAVSEGVVGWRQALLTPTENNEFATIIIRDIVKELPEVLDKGTIPGVVRVILRVFSVSAQQVNIWLVAAADPGLEVVQVADVQHAFRDDVAEASPDG